MKQCMAVLLACALVLSVGATAFGAEETLGGITHLYTFGDSSVDIGRGKALTEALVNGENPPEGAYIKAEDGYYWKGRYSNGKVFTELLAEYLQVDMTNYAVGGAKSGPDATGNTNWSGWLPGTGGIEQTKEFVKDQGGKVDPNALYLISVGGNDTYNLSIEGETVTSVTNKSAANIREMVTDLAKAGAKNFVVMLQYRKPEKTLSPFTEAHQKATLKAMAQAQRELKVNILCVDLTPLTEAMEADMEAFGYKTFSYYMISDWIPAIGYSYHYLDNTELFANPPEGYYTYEYDGFLGYDEDGFWTADQYFYYDEYHVTRTTHQHIFNFLQPLVNDFLGIETVE